MQMKAKYDKRKTLFRERESRECKTKIRRIGNYLEVRVFLMGRLGKKFVIGKRVFFAVFAVLTAIKIIQNSK